MLRLNLTGWVADPRYANDVSVAVD